MKFESIQNCIFDFDHTLIDTDGAFEAYRRELASQLRHYTALDACEIADAIVQTGRRLETQFFASRLDLIESEVVAVRLKELSIDDLNQIAFAVRTTFHRYLRQYERGESIRAMLDSAVKSDINLYMFTGGSPAHTADKLMGSRLWTYFKTVYTGDLHPFEDRPDSGVVDWRFLLKDLGELAPIVSLGPNPKSSAQGFQLLLSHAELDAERTLMIGNHYRDDVLSAQQAGLRTAQAAWFSRDIMDGVVPDIVLDEPSNLFAR